MNENKLTGISVPLGALYTKDNQVIGEFPDLQPFCDYCKSCGVSIIQLLPVNDTGTQSSPYSGLSAFALHPIYIRIKDIPEFAEVYKKNEKFKNKYDSFISENKYSLRYNYDAISNRKTELLKLLYEETETGKTGKPNDKLSKWIKSNQWVKTYAVYKNLKWNYMQASWKSWHENDQHKSEEQILELWNTKAFKKEHLFFVWVQEIADSQFEKSVSYIKKAGILLKGDMPILMNEDSCDVWASPLYFNQALRAGSPCDGENPKGQNWGFPIYNWKNLKADDYCWWKERLLNASKYYDAYRLDHILGFFRIWAIPESDSNALNGHTEPYSAIKRETLYELGFDDDRIRWLSQPHIPTSTIERITNNYDVAIQILSTLCDRIGSEELWRFTPAVEGSKYIQDADLTELCRTEQVQSVKEKLIEYWSNRTLIEISKNKFVPLWTYYNSTSWNTLNDKEKNDLQACFCELNSKNEKLWQKQADGIFSALTKSVKGVFCGEDLGVNIDCVPTTMEKHKILGLRVIRWCREWAKDGQPYIPLSDYTPLSVATTSVHDSSTIRQWWADEHREEFTPEIAEKIMKEAASSASMWFIPPIQDFLYMNKKYWLSNTTDERINVPGTVSDFNWTYRLPVSLEDLLEDKDLINKIKNISKR